MAARQHGDASTRCRSTIEDNITETSTRMHRHNEVIGIERHILDRRGYERHAPGEARPRCNQLVVQPCTRRGNRRVDHDRLRRRIIQQQHRVREHARLRLRLAVRPAHLGLAAVAQEADGVRGARVLGRIVGHEAERPAQALDVGGAPGEERPSGPRAAPDRPVAQHRGRVALGVPGDRVQEQVLADARAEQSLERREEYLKTGSQSNFSDEDFLWAESLDVNIKKIDDENTQLNLELLIVPKLPVPGSLVTGEVAYAADEAVTGSRNRAEANAKKK